MQNDPYNLYQWNFEPTTYVDNHQPDRAMMSVRRCSVENQTRNKDDMEPTKQHIQIHTAPNHGAHHPTSTIYLPRNTPHHPHSTLRPFLQHSSTKFLRWMVELQNVSTPHLFLFLPRPHDHQFLGVSSTIALSTTKTHQSRHCVFSRSVTNILSTRF